MNSSSNTSDSRKSYAARSIASIRIDGRAEPFGSKVAPNPSVA